MLHSYYKLTALFINSGTKREGEDDEVLQLRTRFNGFPEGATNPAWS